MMARLTTQVKSAPEVMDPLWNLQERSLAERKLIPDNDPLWLAIVSDVYGGLIEVSKRRGEGGRNCAMLAQQIWVQDCLGKTPTHLCSLSCRTNKGRTQHYPSIPGDYARHVAELARSQKTFGPCLIPFSSADHAVLKPRAANLGLVIAKRPAPFSSFTMPVPKRLKGPLPVAPAKPVKGSLSTNLKKPSLPAVRKQTTGAHEIIDLDADDPPSSAKASHWLDESAPGIALQAQLTFVDFDFSQLIDLDAVDPPPSVKAAQAITESALALALPARLMLAQRRSSRMLTRRRSRSASVPPASPSSCARARRTSPRRSLGPPSARPAAECVADAFGQTRVLKLGVAVRRPRHGR